MGSEGDRFSYQQIPGTGLDIEAYKVAIQSVMPSLYSAKANQKITDLPTLQPATTDSRLAKSGLKRSIETAPKSEP